MKNRSQKDWDNSAELYKKQYENLKKNKLNTDWFKKEYPDEKTAQDLFGQSRKEIYKEELAMAKRAAEGSAFTAKYYDKMVNQKIRDLDISTATQKEVHNVYKEAVAEYLNKSYAPGQSQHWNVV